MGNCICAGSGNRQIGLPPHDRTPYSELLYPRRETAVIKVRDQAQNLIRKERVVFEFPKPAASTCANLIIGGQKAVVSSDCYAACILPGFDPKGLMQKKCQDMCVAVIEDNTFMAFVFDGHGKTGQNVVEFCRTFTSGFLAANKAVAATDPQRFFVDLISALDTDLRASREGIDTTYSGTTAVGVLITGGDLACAGVGDSRAVLGTAKPPQISYAEQPMRGENKQILQGVMRRRSIQLEHPLAVAQLTKDQKPEDPAELERITQNGGVVRRLMNEEGHNIGPWRVWKKGTNYPGIAMSRSIGDSVGKEIGVVSTPYLCVHALQEEDAFIVLASDGVWDVMENSEVVDFVEAYRQACKRGNYTRQPLSESTRPANAPIAQLLCEEARMRWLVVIEEENVAVDDISCVVVEIRDSSVQYVHPPDRSQLPNMDAADAPNVPEGLSIRASTVTLRDPRRGSIIDSSLNPEN